MWQCFLQRDQIHSNLTLFSQSEHSAGVLNKYGDDEYSTPSLFNPPLPEDKMNSLRKMFFVEYEDGSYRETMSIYKELIVQLAEDDPNDPNTEFLFFETEAGKKGHCHIWQDLDIGVEGKYFDGSRTILCELSPSVVNEDPLSDDLGNSNFEYSDAELKELIDSTVSLTIHTDMQLCFFFASGLNPLLTTIHFPVFTVGPSSESYYLRAMAGSASAHTPHHG